MNKRPAIRPFTVVKSTLATFILAIVTTTSTVAQMPSTVRPSAPLPDTVLRKLPDAIPPALFRKMFSSNRLVGSPGLAWKKQKVVTVAFHGGTDDLYALIEQTANEWTSQGGQLKLSFQDKPGHYRQWTAADKSPVANIRIAFNDGAEGGFWSLLGVLAKNVDPNEPTMNFEGFPEALQKYFHGQNASEWVQTYEHTTILHEFGHALGLSHEHFNPQCQKDLKMDTIIAYLMGPPNNWSQEQARFNMDAQYYIQVLGRQAGSLESKLVTSRTTDQASVMLYLFPVRYYLSGDKSVCKPIGDSGKDYPTTLSAGDKEFFLANYTTISSPFGGS
jgi:hypothetical protein